MFEIRTGDCLDVLRGMADSSVDSIVTDPPYGLAFMGKKWDYDVPSVEIWAECLRVLKPGGHLLAFAGTRTQHRMAVRIEDAGFEIRDMIAWVYGSGFPKSLDVSKAIDKRGGSTAGFEAFRDAVRAAMQRSGVSRAELTKALGNHMLSHYLTAGSQPAVPNVKDYRIIRDTVRLGHDWDHLFAEEAEREVLSERSVEVKGGTWAEQASSGRYSVGERTIQDTAPATPAAQQWAGWGTALKPALEPITVARKPLVGTVAENVLQHGTGGINVDGCRVGTQDNLNGGFYRDSPDEYQAVCYGKHKRGGEFVQPSGRWPANLIHDGSEEVVAGFPVTGPSKAASDHGKSESIFLANQWKRGASHEDSGGSAARFFYCAKASKRDRDEGLEAMPEQAYRGNYGDGIQDARPHTKPGYVYEGARRNTHPTVKPTDLMRYLCRLVTPPGGLVLDPFAGSGSTGKGALLEGFRFLGIERDPDYARIAQARCAAVEPKLPL